MTNDFLKLTWEDYFKLCDSLVEQVKNEGYTDIIAISRGGLIPAQYLAYKLDIKRVHVFGVSSYKGQTQDRFEIYQEIDTHFSDKNKVLIVDDIADTGKTLYYCLDYYSVKLYYAQKVHICSLHYKPQNSIIKPEYYAQTVENNTWVVYPYDNK